MQNRILHCVSLLITAILLVGTLAFTATANVRNPVPRPLKVLGYMTMLVTPVPGTTIANVDNEEYGNATYLGRYHNVGNGTMDLATRQFLSGSGTATAANGDSVDFLLGDRFVFTGGTGRFAYVSGYMVMTGMTQSDPADHGDGTFTVSIVYTAEGEITF